MKRMILKTIAMVLLLATVLGMFAGCGKTEEARPDMSAVVDAAALIEKGIISACPYGLKVLANGTLTKKITVKAAAFSESAKEKIEQAGGKTEVV